MKYILTALLFFFTLTLSAQNQCGSSYVLFNPPSNMHPQRIENLGNNPQIKCLQNVTEKSAFFKAIQTCQSVEIYKPDFEELDKILKEIGFANGLGDANFTANSLNYETIPSGSKGMLGFKNKKSKRIGYVYAELAHNVPGWKVTSPTGCFVYIFTRCGNAFYPTQPCPNTKCPPCPKVTINYTGDSKDVECETHTIKKQISIDVYAFYKRKQSQKQKQEQKQEDNTVWLYQEKMEVAECDNVNSKYSFSIAPYNSSSVICKDTTISLPVKISMQASSSTSQSPSYDYTNRRIMIEVDKRIFRLLKKRSKSNTNNPPQQQQ